MAMLITMTEPQPIVASSLSMCLDKFTCCSLIMQKDHLLLSMQWRQIFGVDNAAHALS